MALTRRQLTCRLACLPASFTLGVARAAPVPATLTVAAASDLKFALELLARQFEQQQGTRLRLVFGSSGHLASQILQGAPFDLFFSADEALVFRLADASKTVDRGQLYALGRLALVVAKDSRLQPDGQLSELRSLLGARSLGKLAIANPEHAPYGQRAREALQHAGLWQAAQPHVVLGENVAQATQFVLTGAAQAALVAHSLALAPEVAARTRHALVDAAWHQPLRQRLAVIKRSPPKPESHAAAMRFAAFIATPAARALLMANGFDATAA